MKKALLLFLLLLAPWAASAQEPAGLELPDELKAAIDKKLPGWKFAEVREEIRDYFKERSPGTRLNLVRGDFDGNGLEDYATLVEHGKIYDQGREVGSNAYVVVGMRRERGYKLHVLEAEGEYLELMRKGEKDYDFEKQTSFTYENDAIFAGIFEKAGSSYVFKNGKFHVILTSD